MIIHENIFDAIELLEKKSFLLKLKDNQITSSNLKRNNIFNVIQTENGKLGAIPPGFRGISYRGENQIFPSCKASIYRNSNRVKIIRDEIKIIDFKLILKKFPQVIESENNNYYINFLALAQHYELNTNLIDLTSDLAVAAFFAVNRYNSKIKDYEVIEEGIGVIKRYFNPILSDKNFEFIGYQIFKRPTYQHAFGIKTSEGEEVESRFENVYFRHSKVHNQKITSLFLKQKNNELFPEEDIFKIAKLLKKSDVVTKNALEIYCKNNQMNIEKISEDLKEIGVKIEDKPVYKISKKKKRKIEKEKRKNRLIKSNLNDCEIGFTSRLVILP